MAALQVRDFPAELYEELRAYATMNHRSMAQQTIAAVDQMIHGGDGRPVTVSAGVGTSRMSKREEILQRAQMRRQGRAGVLPYPQDMLRAAREERDHDVDSFIHEQLEGER